MCCSAKEEGAAGFGFMHEGRRWQQRRRECELDVRAVARTVARVSSDGYEVGSYVGGARLAMPHWHERCKVVQWTVARRRVERAATRIECGVDRWWG